MRGLWNNGPLADKPVLAILMLDGRIFFDSEASCHANAVENLGLDFDQVLDGGFIVGGEFRYGSKDAARLAAQARADRDSSTSCGPECGACLRKDSPKQF